MPRVGPPIEGLIVYPRPLCRRAEGKFAFDNWAEEQVKIALDACPIGTQVRFKVRVGDKTETRRSFTKGRPFFLNGEIYVEICGQTRAFRLSGIEVVDQSAFDGGDEDGD